jgi:hypothetical protein
MTVGIVCVYLYIGQSIIFLMDAVKIMNLTSKRVWKVPISTQLCAAWHTDSLDMVLLPSTSALCYQNCHIDCGTSLEYFGWWLYVRLCTCTYRNNFTTVLGSSVGTETDYGLDSPGIESRSGREFLHTSRPALGPTQSPVQWVLGLSRG